MANEIISEIRLELDKFRQDLKDAEKKSEDSGKIIGDSVAEGVERALGHSSTKMVAFFTSLAGSIAAAFSLKESIHAAVEQENAINQLNAALANSGHYSAQASADFIAFAESLQKVTTVQDDVIIKGGAMIATLGRVSGEGLERASKAALDLAAGLGGKIGVEQAFDLVAKASAGNVGALSRYGIKVQETGDRVYDFNRALTALETRFRGMAAAQTGTFSGALDQTKNSFNDVLKIIGNVITQSPTTIAAIKAVGKLFSEAADRLEKFAKGKDLINLLSQEMVKLGQATILYVVSPLELGFNILNLGFQSIRLMAAQIVYDMARVKASFEWVTNFGKVSTETEKLVADSKKQYDDLEAATIAASDKLFNFDASAGAAKLLESLQEALSNIKPALHTDFTQMGEDAKRALEEATNGITFDGVVDAMKRTSNKMQISADSIAKSINGAIVNGLAAGFAAMGKALVTGENLFAAFGKAILSAFGQLLITLGTQVIAVGLAMANVPILFNLQGAAAIIAGAAMVTAGGVLTALAGSGGGGGAAAGAPAGGGGGSAQSGFENPLSAEPANLERQAPSTNIAVHIAGNILDRRESGLAIAEIIQETFGSNGITYATAGA